MFQDSTINCSSGDGGGGILIKMHSRDFPHGPGAKTLSSQCRRLGSIPAQGTRSQMLQLRPSAAK